MRFSGPRSGETFKSDLRGGGNSDFVALTSDHVLRSDLRPRGNSDLVAGLEDIQI